jgi:ATP-dependent helicase STH1/SNF2
MEHSELPAFYRRDLGAEMAEALINEEEAGRGRRARNAVQYNTDLMSDDAWIRANFADSGDEAAPPEPDMEDPAPDDEPEDPAEAKRRKAMEKKKRKEMNERLQQAEAEGMPLTTTSIKIKPFGAAAAGGAGGDGDEGTPVGKKGKRPRVSATPSVQGDDAPVVCFLCTIIHRRRGGG